MGEPARPVHLAQNPAKSGYSLGWLSCAAFAFAMGVRKATLGRHKPSGEQVRETITPADDDGGLRMDQVASVGDEYGIEVEVHAFGLPATPAHVASQLRAGRGVQVGGDTGALLDTPQRSTGGSIAHSVYVNEGRGWNADGTPDEVLVYDPAADGRSAGWGKAAQGPQWWSWALLVKFALRLTNGRGVYCVLFPDTEPHVHLKWRGKRASPFPDRQKGSAGTGRYTIIRNSPRRRDTSGRDTRKRLLKHGAIVTAYQVTTAGEKMGGSSRWYGNHDGTEWWHDQGVSHEGA